MSEQIWVYSTTKSHTQREGNNLMGMINVSIIELVMILMGL